MHPQYHLDFFGVGFLVYIVVHNNYHKQCTLGFLVPTKYGVKYVLKGNMDYKEFLTLALSTWMLWMLGPRYLCPFVYRENKTSTTLGHDSHHKVSYTHLLRKTMRLCINAIIYTTGCYTLCHTYLTHLICSLYNIIQPCGLVSWPWNMSFTLCEAPEQSKNIHLLFIHSGLHLESWARRPHNSQES